MNINKFQNSIIYGKCGIIDYTYLSSISGSISGLTYATISSPIYQTISSNIYKTISSLVYTSISSSFNNTISSTVYLTDSSGNQYPSVTYYNYGGSNKSYISNGYVYNTHLANTVYNKL